MDFVFLNVGVTSPKGFSGGFKPVVEIGKRLISRGHGLTILTSGAGETAFRNMGLDADFWIIDPKEEAAGGLIEESFTMVVRMVRAGLLLRRKRFHGETVIFGVSDLLWEVFPLLFVKGESIIRVSSLHMTYPQPFKGYKGAFTKRLKVPSPRETLAYLQHRLSLFCMRRASDLVFAQSNIWRYLLDKGISADRIVLYTPGVEVDFIDSVTPSAGRYDACWIGRYHPMKGCEDLLRVWATVCRASKDARLAIMGNVVAKLRPLIKERHLERNIELLGPVDDETKFAVMKASKLFLFPSYYESWGHAAMEAMACSLPVIAYDLPVYRDIYTGGMTRVPIGDERALAREAAELLENEEERRRLSSEARDTAARHEHGWDEAVERLLTKIEELQRR
jgi:glycosyltransferase involved in cell wall biosynthesis